MVNIRVAPNGESENMLAETVARVEAARVILWSRPISVDEAVSLFDLSTESPWNPIIITAAYQVLRAQYPGAPPPARDFVALYCKADVHVFPDNGGDNGDD